MPRVTTTEILKKELDKVRQALTNMTVSRDSWKTKAVKLSAEKTVGVNDNVINAVARACTYIELNNIDKALIELRKVI